MIDDQATVEHFQHEELGLIDVLHGVWEFHVAIRIATLLLHCKRRRNVVRL